MNNYSFIEIVYQEDNRSRQKSNDEFYSLIEKIKYNIYIDIIIFLIKK